MPSVPSAVQDPRCSRLRRKRVAAGHFHVSEDARADVPVATRTSSGPNPTTFLLREFKDAVNQ
jgi:hypothetical protein